ncbi:hypothetical protein CJU89_6747 [Yarrowia sp. B02]|nr:hypothetical protein CJU89_6747 [Yarrowia sp. B02]
MRPPIVRHDPEPVIAYIDGLYNQFITRMDAEDPWLKEYTHIREILRASFVHQLVEGWKPPVPAQIKYSDWACAMWLFAHHFGDIMEETGLLCFFYDIVYSVVCGYAAGPFSQSRYNRFRPLVFTEAVTQKDARDIASELLMTKEAVFNYNYSHPLFNVYPSHLTPELMTLDLMKKEMWADTKAAYWRLKRGAHEVHDFDAVFEHSEPPFLNDSIFLDLANTIERNCGWLPVGKTNDGVFRFPNPLQSLVNFFVTYGNVPAEWQTRYQQAKDKKKLEAKAKPIGRGMVTLKDGLQKNRREEFLKMFPDAKDLPSRVLRFLIDEFDHCQINSASLLKQMDDYPVRQRYMETVAATLENGDTWTGDIRSLPERKFWLDKRNIDKNNTSGLLSTMEGGQVGDLPFGSFVDHLQQSKLLFFYEKMFTRWNGKCETDYGLFLQACIDYCNVHDPEKDLETLGPDWVAWKVSDTAHDLIINDEKLFIFKPSTVNLEIRAAGGCYRVTKRGYVCYLYNPLGEPMLRQAYYCETAQHNLLDADGLDCAKGAFNRHYETSMMYLPRLQLVTELGGEFQLKWGDRELHHVDISYWHKALGHVSEETVEKYRGSIKGIPPFFWPFEIQCEECGLTP